MEFSIEKRAMQLRKSGKRYMTEGIKQTKSRKSENLEKSANNWKYSERTSSKNWRRKKKKCISVEQENYSKPNYFAGIS